jgi:hypothetical protein
MHLVGFLLFLEEVIMEHSPRRIIVCVFLSCILEDVLSEFSYVNLGAYPSMWKIILLYISCMHAFLEGVFHMDTHLTWFRAYFWWYAPFMSIIWCISLSISRWGEMAWRGLCPHMFDMDNNILLYERRDSLHKEDLSPL